MKKNIILICLIFITTKLFCQDNEYIHFDTITQKVVFEKVIEFPNKTKKELFLKSKKWFSYGFSDSKFESTGNGFENDSSTIKLYLYKKSPKSKNIFSSISYNCSLLIKLKDNKVKIIISNIEFLRKNLNAQFKMRSIEFINSDKFISEEKKEDYKNEIIENSNYLITNFINFINNNQQKEDNW